MISDASAVGRERAVNVDGDFYSALIAQGFNDDGSLRVDAIRYDNGDARYDAFDFGDLTSRLEYDGDGSEDWVVRITEHRSDGLGDTVTTYDDVNDVPDAFAPDLAFAQVDLV